MRDPLGKGMDKAREAIRGHPLRPADALAFFFCDRETLPGRKRMAARLTTLSLGTRSGPVKSYQRTGKTYVQNRTLKFLCCRNPATIIPREELFPQICYRPFAGKFRSFTRTPVPRIPEEQRKNGRASRT